jgi:two-component system chemotaxis response regulator CheB
MPQIKVLVIDDSVVMRQLLSCLLAQEPTLEVVGVAADPYIAWRKIQSLHPDVLTLDVEMPPMGGLTFLEKLMRAAPLPVVLVSSLTQSGAETTLRALELGAIDFVSKPVLDVQRGVVELADEIIDKVKAAARVRIRRPQRETLPPAPVVNGALLKSTHKVIAIGASTGGTEALRSFLTALPADVPGIVIVQHMPEKFTRLFAERLNSLCRLRVSEAHDGIASFQAMR